jgi:hypothetical protein
MEVSGHLYASGRFGIGERAPGTKWIRGWLGPRTELEGVELSNLLLVPGNDLRRCSPSLYRLIENKFGDHSYFAFHVSIN